MAIELTGLWTNQKGAEIEFDKDGQVVSSKKMIELFGLEEVLDALPQKIDIIPSGRFKDRFSGNVASKVAVLANCRVTSEQGDVGLRFYDKKTPRVTKDGSRSFNYNPRHIEIYEGKLTLDKKKDIDKLIYIMLSPTCAAAKYKIDDEWVNVSNNSPWLNVKNKFKEAQSVMDLLTLRKSITDAIYQKSRKELQTIAPALGLGVITDDLPKGSETEYVKSIFLKKLDDINIIYRNKDQSQLIKALREFEAKLHSNESHLIGIINNAMKKHIIKQVKGNRNEVIFKWGGNALPSDKDNIIYRPSGSAGDPFQAFIQYVKSHGNIILPKLEECMTGKKEELGYDLDKALDPFVKLLRPKKVEQEDLQNIEPEELIDACLLQEILYWDRKQEKLYQIKASGEEEIGLELDKFPSWKAALLNRFSKDKNLKKGITHSLRHRLKK